MTDLLCSLLSAAVSDLYIKALQSHENSYYEGKCVYYTNARIAERTMEVCQEAQQELVGPLWPETFVQAHNRYYVQQRTDSVF